MDVIGSDSFSEKLAGRLDARHIRIDRRIFPDGEVCPRLAASPGDSVILAERMGLPLYPNRYLAEVLLTLKSLKAMQVSSISMVMPYFIYSRQDRSFRPGEPFSAKHVLELLADSGVSRFFTVSSHMERFRPRLTSPVEMQAYNLDGYSVLGEHLKGIGMRSPIVISPDIAVSMAAQRVASMLDAEHLSVEKERDADTGELTARMFSGDFQGRDAVIVDDIISSGGTMLNAIKIAESCQSGRIVIAAVHAVQQKGIDLLKKHAWKILATDTVDTQVSQVSVIDKIAEALQGRGLGDSATTEWQEQSQSREQQDYGYARISEPRDRSGDSASADYPEPAEGAFSMFD